MGVLYYGVDTHHESGVSENVHDRKREKGAGIDEDSWELGIRRIDDGEKIRNNRTAKVSIRRISKNHHHHLELTDSYACTCSVRSTCQRFKILIGPHLGGGAIFMQEPMYDYQLTDPSPK